MILHIPIIYKTVYLKTFQELHTIALFHNISPSDEQPEQLILAHKSLKVCYWYVKIPWCGCVEHGLEYIKFYVQNI